MKATAIGYCRVSTDEQVTSGISLADQEERLRLYAASAGLELVTVIVEEGVSGSKALASRPGGGELLRLIKAGKVENVVAVKLDRLFRDASDCLSMTKAWDKAGIALHLIDLGGQSINTSSSMGRFFISTMAAIAELERNLIAERTTAALRHKRRHLQAYGPTPYGYDRQGDELIANRDELAIVARIRELRGNGATMRAIVGALNGANVPTKTGKQWRPSTVAYILKNGLYQQEVAAS